MLWASHTQTESFVVSTMLAFLIWLLLLKPARSAVVSGSDDCNCIPSIVSASSTSPANTTQTTVSIGGGVSVYKYKSKSADPLAPFSDQSVHFLGINKGGNITVYDYQIDCESQCWISSILIQGAAFTNST